MKPSEAATVLGVDVQTVKRWQQEGVFPKPIPDDYLDPVVYFRVRLEQAMRRKVDRDRGLNDSTEPAYPPKVADVARPSRKPRSGRAVDK